MVKQLLRTATLSLACFAASGVQHASSTNLETISANVFNFQHKLANDGNVQSQYKLGEMYEAGAGVEQDLDQAKSWYQQAANSGYAPAINRLTYLDIKANGYSKEQYGDWVALIKTEAGKREQTSMLLLAQMYRQGVGVNKDLVAARALLDKLITTGNLSVDREIVLVDAEMQAKQARQQQQAEQAQQAAAAAREAAARAAAAAVTASQAENVTSESASASIAVEVHEDNKSNEATQPESTMTAEEIARAEKRKHYEEVMLQLQEEQKKLEQQQAWAEN